MQLRPHSIALLLLIAAAPGCDWIDWPPGEPSTSGGDTTDGDTSASDTDGGEPAPTCDLVDTIVAPESCLNDVVDPGEICFVLGVGSTIYPTGIVSSIALPLDGPSGGDLLTSHENGSVKAKLFAVAPWLQISSLLWPQTFPDGPMSLRAVGDFNEDGILDVAAHIDGPTDTIQILLLDGAGNLLAGSVAFTGAELFGPSLYDADEDGHLDLLVVAPGELENVIALRGDGTGQFTVSPQFGWSGAVERHVVGAIQADGAVNDLVWAQPGGELSIHLIGPGDTMLDEQLGPDAEVLDLATADLDADGDGEIVALLSNTIHGTSEIAVLELDATGENFTDTRYPVRCGAVTLAIGDLDADGALDIATAGGDNESESVSIRPGDGQGGFGDLLTVGFGKGIDTLHIVDLNSDGLADLAGSSRAEGSVSYSPNRP
ncbi:FG-GAP repeat domain-containing protein [Nannocystis radixulma]|uniref:VCBS repeat-containing protein n=1 Tax=Nannocystis radixulma TaxID=2995305 RepID=A0ABT5B899_9BACT|nr:VCBS repeat-containing protein [Nannocystis radixulma]MDC0670331.1 VCBS repeat-containing protein [Nannocystis radixulma]